MKLILINIEVDDININLINPPMTLTGKQNDLLWPHRLLAQIGFKMYTILWSIKRALFFSPEMLLLRITCYSDVDTKVYIVEYLVGRSQYIGMVYLPIGPLFAMDILNTGAKMIRKPNNVRKEDCPSRLKPCECQRRVKLIFFCYGKTKKNL